MSGFRRFPISSYLITAFALTYIGGIGFYLLARRAQALLGTDVAYVNELVLKFGPSLAGLLTVWVLARGRGLRQFLLRLTRWRAPVALYLFAVAVPPATFLAVLVLGSGTRLGKRAESPPSTPERSLELTR